MFRNGREEMSGITENIRRRNWVKAQRKADYQKITTCQGLVKQELARCS